MWPRENCLFVLHPNIPDSFTGTFLFPSKKNVGMIPVESNLELAYAIELERDLSVVSYRTQALKIQLKIATLF